ncbi:MAG: hypothetical protein L3K03_01960 [Thermoplasmata archaeon]|nr:hypothetical protein [Thermoplasmata archaeon]
MGKEKGPAEERSAWPVALGSGFRQGLPLVFLGAASVGLSSWMLVSHVETYLGRLPLWPWLLTIGLVALLGGILCAFLDWEAPPEATLDLDATEIVVPRAEWERWLRVKVNMASGDVDGTFSEGPPPPPGDKEPVEESESSETETPVVEPTPPVAAPPPPEPVRSPSPPPVLRPPAPRPVPPVALRSLAPSPSAEKKLSGSDMAEIARRLQSIIAAEKLLRGMGEAEAYLNEVEPEIVEVERQTGISRDSGESAIDYCQRLVFKFRTGPKPSASPAPSVAPSPAPDAPVDFADEFGSRDEP